jgi:hypothetical protein
VSGAVNQNRLYQGYDRIAQELGFDYAVYPFNMVTPLDSGYQQRLLKVAFAADAKFSVPLKYNKPVWLCYAEGDFLEQNSFLVGFYGTYYIADKQPFLPMQAIRCNRTVTISRGLYRTTGPAGTDLTPFASGLPIFMQFAREDIQKPATTVGGQQLGEAITHWTTFIPGPKGMLQQDDVVTDEADGINYIIDAPDYTNAGYVVHMRLMTI